MQPGPAEWRRIRFLCGRAGPYGPDMAMDGGRSVW